ncbi:MAG: hypothetical protein WA459_06440 [Stellaceae bacterium]
MSKTPVDGIGRVLMSPVQQHKPIVHYVGSIPLPDAETVFRTLSAATGPHLKRLPDGETGIRKTWIRFLQGVLADNPAIEVAQDLPPFKFTQWDGKVLREIPRLRLRPGDVQNRLCRDGDPIVGAIRSPATGGRDPAGCQVPDLAADTDRTNLQQHGAGRPTRHLAGLDAAFHWRSCHDRRRAAQ